MAGKVRKAKREPIKSKKKGATAPPSKHDHSTELSLADVKRVVSLALKFTGCSNWKKCTESDEVHIQDKYLMNGARHLYISYMMRELESIFNVANRQLIHVTPTGSEKITSDVDMQVMLNMCELSTLTPKTFDSIIDSIVDQIEKGDALWRVGGEPEMERSIDLNIYPAALLNYLTSADCRTTECAEGFLYREGNWTCFHPILSTEALQKEFVAAELERVLGKEEEPDTRLYYEQYRKHVAPAVFSLVKKCTAHGERVGKRQQQRLKTDSEINREVGTIVDYNHIGPDMFFTVSSIIFVVWNMQMGNKIPEKDVRVYAVVAAVENAKRFLHSKKEKYRLRATTAAELASPELFEEALQHGKMQPELREFLQTVRKKTDASPPSAGKAKKSGMKGGGGKGKSQLPAKNKSRKKSVRRNPTRKAKKNV